MFGPLVVFGLGGTDTDPVDDRTARLVPLPDVDADEMLTGLRSAPKLFTSDADKAVVRDVLVRVARMAEANRTREQQQKQQPEEPPEPRPSRSRHHPNG